MIAVVVVNWNGIRFLDQCLSSVYQQTVPPGMVLVVDNGSTDGSVAHLRRAWPAVRVIEAGVNLGFSGGNNLGIRGAMGAGADEVLLLNNDAYLSPDALAQLSAALERGGTDTWAAAPKILFHHDPTRIWSAGGRFDWWRGLSLDRGSNEEDRGQYDRLEEVDFANACCLLVRGRAFRDVGLLDERYFMYFEDSDFAARLRRAGGKIVYQPAARVLHEVQGSFGRTERPSSFVLYYGTRNRALFIAQNAPDAARRIAAHGFTVGSRLVRTAQAVLHGRPGEAGVILRALRAAYLRHESGLSTERFLAARP